MTKRYSNYSPGQRVETTDAVNAAVDSHVDTIESVGNDVLVGQSRSTRNYILSGFTTTAPTATTIRVTRGAEGAAILGLRRNGAVESGFIVSGGDEFRDVDVSGLDVGNYSVYVRAELIGDSYANRFFWNPLSATPVETPANVPTRLAENWALAVDLTSPGPEWALVATFEQTATPEVTNLADARDIAFDTPTGDVPDSDIDRTIPQDGLIGALRLLQRQIQDLNASLDWKTAIPTGGAVMVDGSRELTGNLNFASGATANIGNARAVERIQARHFDGARQGDILPDAENPEITQDYWLDGTPGSTTLPSRKLVRRFRGFSGTSGGILSYTDAGKDVFEYVCSSAAGSGSGYSVVVGAEWNQATGLWTARGSGTGGGAAALYHYSDAGVSVYVRDFTAPTTWADTFSGIGVSGAWELVTSTTLGGFRSFQINGQMNLSGATFQYVPVGAGSLVSNGAGGLSTNTSYGNISSVTLAGDGPDVVFDSPYGSVNDYTVSVVTTAQAAPTPGRHWPSVTKSAGSFRIFANAHDNTTIDMRVTNLVGFEYQIFERVI